TIKMNGSDTAILDDGFQYWELERDLDIVLIDSRNPFGNGQLFPRGVLREPKDSIKRADIIVFTKVNKALCDIDIVKESLRKIKDDIVFAEAIHKPKGLYEIRTKKILDLTYTRGKKTILFSSIGDPEYFEETVKDLGANIIMHLKFPDHHNYSIIDIEHIAKMCNEKNFDILLTTEKDAVKLNRLGLAIADYTVTVLSVEMEISAGRENVIAGLHSLYNN
ncbi:MAG: tetraacyldisaccharide 4'-kinase, partial [Candidatus Omnitrophica bacterium]|nr:tetraacyldisaccharide 4'-kinase [Candidatus Omnitrophota bacterium]